MEGGNGRFWIRLALLVVVCIYVEESMSVEATSVGVNYGLLGDNLPQPSEVVTLMHSISIKKTRIYSPEPEVLMAFANTGISLVVGTKIEDMGSLTDPTNAAAWVKQNVLAYLPATNIIGIAVGNEILSDYLPYAQYLLPAIKNVHSALVSAGLQGKIWVSTAHALSVLATSYPPSLGTFRQDITAPYIQPLLEFHSETSSPFLVNIYPFFAYISDPQNISLNYALFEPGVTVVDPNSSLSYTNMFDSQLDAVYSAIQRLGYSNIPLVISETGWPSKGDSNQIGASVTNAQLYTVNLAQYLASGKGTPMRPGSSIDVYIFALFNEDLKPGPTSERNYGLFNPNGTLVYDLSKVSTSTSTTSSVQFVSSSIKMVAHHPLLVVIMYLIGIFVSI